MLNKKNTKRIVASILSISMLVVTFGVYDICMKKSSGQLKAAKLNDEVIQFQINSTSIDKQDVHLVNDAVFDVNYFSEKSTVYNNDLAKMSIQMSLAAASTATSFDKYGETLNMAYVKDDYIDFDYSRNGYLAQAYKDMGFSNDVYYKYDTSLNDNSDTTAHGIASKKILVDGEKFTLVSVVVRSSAYGGEWAGNYKVVNEDGVSGYYAAGMDLYNHIKEYIETNKLGKKTKLWISGVSRGGAAVNVAAAYIDRACRDNILELERDNVYAYAIAVPNCVKDEDKTEVRDELYDNIMNIIYDADIVVRPAPEDWGYTKYGKIYTIPSIHISNKNMKKIMEGKKVNSKDISSEEIDLARAITNDYNEFRYGDYPAEYDNVKDKLYAGFTVDAKLTEAFDTLFNILGDNEQEYKMYWQDAITDIIPYIIARAKKYDENTNEWVKYTSLKEYLVAKYGEEVLDKSVELGVYSDIEYNNRIEEISNLVQKGIVNESKKESLVYLVDMYYGIKIALVKYNISNENISVLISRTFSRLGNLIKNAYPIADSKNCMKNHSGEFYLAWLNNYNPCTQTVIK